MVGAGGRKGEPVGKAGRFGPGAAELRRLAPWLAGKAGREATAQA